MKLASRDLLEKWRQNKGKTKDHVNQSRMKVRENKIIMSAWAMIAHRSLKRRSQDIIQKMI